MKKSLLPLLVASVLPLAACGPRNNKEACVQFTNHANGVSCSDTGGQNEDPDEICRNEDENKTDKIEFYACMEKETKCKDDGTANMDFAECTALAPSD